MDPLQFRQSHPRAKWSYLAWAVAVIGATGITTLLACQRDVRASAKREGVALGTAALAPSVDPPRANEAPEPEMLRRHTAPERVIAIGDLHGDLSAARRAFRTAGLIDDSDRWIGGKSVAVQTGDVLDRGNDERALLEWLERIAASAEAGGGKLYRVSGNHEVMNVASDLRYVTDAGFDAFAEYAKEPVPAPLLEAPARARGRLMAFLPGGPWARRLAPHPAVLIVNDSVFAHGGLLPKHLAYGLERINTELAAWMRGVGKLGPVLSGDDTPYWDRTYGDAVSEANCRTLTSVLERLSVKRLVIGHTPQKSGITFACDRRVVRIDVGLSSYYGNNPAAVLEIDGGQLNVLTEGSAKGKSSSRAARAQEAYP